MYGMHVGKRVGNERDDETSRVLFVRRRGALSAGVNWRARGVLVGLYRMDDE